MPSTAETFAWSDERCWRESVGWKFESRKDVLYSWYEDARQLSRTPEQWIQSYGCVLWMAAELC